MEIALLNLQYDTNYGGNIQRYALMTILQRMGHDVTHLNLRFNFNDAPFYKKTLRFFKRILLMSVGKQFIPLLMEYKQQKRYIDECKITDAFYDKYIKHTVALYGKEYLSKFINFDAYIVGSDQVWRKSIADFYGVSTYFFDFLPCDSSARRIAYGVSFGTAENELNEDDIKMLSPLYSKFKAVSVREESGLKLLKDYSWNNPKPQLVLDPTMLLTMDDYLKLINDGVAKPSAGNMFCYILDPTPEKDVIIKEYEIKKHLKPFMIGDKSNKVPIQQWLKSFSDSEFVVTDSFHGLVFCIIFNKPFKLIRNKFRGNARFDSIMHELQIPEDTEKINWNRTNELLKQKREISMKFLRDALALT